MLSSVVDDVSAANLAALVASANASGVDPGEFASTTFETFVSGSSPTASMADGNFWYDVTNDLWRQKRGSNWSDRRNFLELFNDTGSDIEQGAMVVIETDGTTSPVATEFWPEVIGCAMSTIADQARGLVRTLDRSGPPGQILVEGPVSPGDHLVASSNLGYAKSSTFLDPDGDFDMGVTFAQALFGVAASSTALSQAWFFG